MSYHSAHRSNCSEGPSKALRATKTVRCVPNDTNGAEGIGGMLAQANGVCEDPNDQGAALLCRTVIGSLTCVCTRVLLYAHAHMRVHDMTYDDHSEVN